MVGVLMSDEQIKILESLSDEELLDLHRNVKMTLDMLEKEGYTFVEDWKLPKTVSQIATKQYSDMNAMTLGLEKGKISIAEYNKLSRVAVQDSFTKAYAIGKGVPIDKLTLGDAEYLKRAVDAEIGYATRFGQDIANNRLKMSRATRAGMYGQSVEGIAWNGKVENQNPNTRIDWVLGAAEHCPDCIILAASGPYTKNSLPATPRSGDTQCRSRCQCHLRFHIGKVSKKERDATAIYEKKREESLYNLMSPDVPTGMRKPTSTESRYIAKMRNKINFYRRKIAISPKAGDDFKNAIKMRRKYNAELIEFVDKNSIYEVPVYSVDDVISGEHLGARAKRQIFAGGFDSGSFDLLEKKAFDNAISSYETKVGSEFSEAKKKSLEVVAIPYRGRERGSVVSYNLIGETLEDTFLILSKVMKLAMDKTTIQVAPFDDVILEKVGVWICGDVKEVEQLLLEVNGNG